MPAGVQRNVLVLLEQVIAAHRRGDIDTAQRGYEAVLQQQPNEPDALGNLGNIFRDKGEHTRAIEYLEKAVGMVLSH